MIGVFGKPTLPPIRLPTLTTTEKARPKEPEHRMSELMRRNAVTPLDNRNRILAIDGRVTKLEGRVTALEKWRGEKGAPKRAASLPKPAAPLKKEKPVTPKPPVPKETGGFTLERGDWTPNWDRLLGQRN